MEKFIIGLFSEQLSTFIHGFHKEQLNANLFNGKGEISDVQVKVEPVNDILKHYTSLIELSSVYLSTMNFNVTSFRLIKKAPIEVSIDEVHIVLTEPLQSEGPMTTAWNKLQQSWNEIAKSIVQQKREKPTPYGLLERIQDNITLDVHRVYITFQPLGKFKTRSLGVWTPPAISVLFRELRYVSVDEFGEEGTPDEVWRHNTRSGRQEAALRYEKGQGGVRALQHRTVMIYKKVTMEMSLAVGERCAHQKEGEQGDVSTSMNISAKDTFMSGRVVLGNLPLQSHLCLHRRIRDNAILAVQVDASFMNMEVEIDPEVLPLLIHALAGLLFCFRRGETYVDPLSKDNDFNSHGNEEEDKNVKTGVDTSVDHSVNAHDAIPFIDYDDDDIIDNGATGTNTMGSGSEEGEWPVLILPAGLVIVEKISFSLSIHHIGLRIRYSPDTDEYLQITMKGLMAEIIWPKGSNENGRGLGGNVQLSLAYVNVQELHARVMQQILHGGHQFNERGDFVANESSPEGMFPMFESTGIRTNHMDLRSTFPMQFFGWKATIDVVGNEKIWSLKSKMSVSNEIGINDFVLNVLPETLTRLSNFSNESKDLIKSKWFSGDWKEETGLKDIEKYLFDGMEEKNNEKSISPDLLDINAKLCGAEIHLPPLAANKLQSGTLILSMPECMFILSPLLPRRFLTEDIPTNDGMHYVSDDTERSIFSSQFPNDLKDATEEDNVQIGQFVRMQISLTNASLNFRPSLPCYDALEPNRIISAAKFVVLGSYENCQDKNSEAHSQCFLSSLIQDGDLNVDFDVLSGVLAAIMSQIEAFPQGESSDVFQNIPVISLPCKVHARMSITKFNMSVWRQHLHLGKENSKMEISSLPVIPVARLLRYNIEGVEMGMSLLLNDNTHGVNPFLFKCSMEKMRLFANDFDVAKALDSSTEGSPNIKDFDELLIFSFDAETLGGQGSKSILFRVEKWIETESFELGMVLKGGNVEVREDLDSIFRLIMEGALHPDWVSFSFISSLHSTSSNEPQRVQSLDRRLQILSTCLCLEPEQIGLVNIKVYLEDICCILPMKGKKVVLGGERVQLFSGYLRGSAISENQGNRWESIYSDKTPGFHHKISSTQRCLIHHSEGKGPTEVLKTFSTRTYFHPKKFNNTVSDCFVAFDQWIIWDELYRAGLMYKDKFLSLYNALDQMINELGAMFSAEKDNEDQVCSKHAAEESPLSLACDASRTELNTAKKLLSEIRENVTAYESRIRKKSNQSGEEKLRLRGRLLETELDRIAVISLVCHQMSGYLRVGGTALSGQRFVNFTHFWRFYALLKGSNLLIFEDTTQTKPMYLISLIGTTIHSVSGSGAKRVLSRAFALVEQNGQKTFFVAPSYGEFESWVSSLKLALGDVEIPPDRTKSEEIVPSESTRGVNSSGTTNLETIVPREYDEFNGTICSFDDPLLDLSASESVGAASSSFSEDGLDDSYTISSTFDETNESSSDKRGAKFRDRMAKMKASMKNNVKNMNENVKKKTENRVGRKQRSGASSNGMALPNSTMKMKQIRVNNVEPQTKEDVKIAPHQELHMMPGNWECQVQISAITVEPGLTEDLYTKDESLPQILIDITLTRNGISNKIDPIGTHLKKSLLEFLDLLSTVMTTLITMKQNARQINRHDLLLTHLVNCGQVLQGLIPLAKPQYPKHFDHIGSVVSILVNALFSTPIPRNIFKTILSFFEIKDLEMEDSVFQDFKDELPDLANDYKPDTPATLPQVTNILGLLHNCELSISKVERFLKTAQTLSAKNSHDSSSRNKLKHLKPSTFNPSPRNKIMQDALISAMLERDEAHSALVSSRVFHAHQIDQQSRKIEILHSRIRTMEESNDLDSAPAAAYFLGKDVIPHLDHASKIEKDMIQNVDVELLELCRQLSTAISSRVAAELEIVRIKESRQVAHLSEAATRTEMEEKLSKYKSEIELEKRTRLEAEKEVLKWKKAYKALMETDTPCN